MGGSWFGNHGSIVSSRIPMDASPPGAIRPPGTRDALDPAGVARVAERHPRHRFTVDAEPPLRAHVANVPACRVAASFRAGFGQALKLSSWRAADRATAAPQGALQ